MNMSPWSESTCNRAVELLRAGELVAFPTETVYGLGADASNPDAVQRIFTAKGRPANHPVIVHLAHGSQLHEWARDIPEVAWRLIEQFWPGPLTLILKRASSVPDVVTGGQDTVGVRCPAHPVAHALLQAFLAAGGSGALAAPSANRFGRISPTRAQHVADEFGHSVPMIIDGGECEVGIESTILDLSRAYPVILRPGHISAREIERVTGVPVYLPDGRYAGEQQTSEPNQSNNDVAVPHRPPIHAVVSTGALANEDEAAGYGSPGEEGLAAQQSGVTPRTPGALKAHYAPRTPLEIVAPAALTGRVNELLDAAADTRIAIWSRELPNVAVAKGSSATTAESQRVLWMEAPVTPEEYGRALYATLRELDAASVHRILVEEPPTQPGWEAIHDRLGRAAVGSGGA